VGGEAGNRIGRTCLVGEPALSHMLKRAEPAEFNSLIMKLEFEYIARTVNASID
jgi:hypothetical protein